MGIAGAAIATAAGQIVAALIVWKGGFCKSPKRERPFQVLPKLQNGYKTCPDKSFYRFLPSGRSSKYKKLLDVQRGKRYDNADRVLEGTKS